MKCFRSLPRRQGPLENEAISFLSVNVEEVYAPHLDGREHMTSSHPVAIPRDTGSMTFQVREFCLTVTLNMKIKSDDQPLLGQQVFFVNGTLQEYKKCVFQPPLSEG